MHRRLKFYLIPERVWRETALAIAVLTGMASAHLSNAQTVVRYDASGYLRASEAGSNAAPSMIAQPYPLAAPVGASVSFSARAVGSTPIIYQWQFKSNNIPGANADTLFMTNITSNNFGAYRVIVSNAFGSVTSSNALLQLDSDRDGMADSWETNYFTSITNRTGFEDYDQDGVSDRDEFVEGTLPRTYNSANPRLTIISDRGEVFVTPNILLFTNNQVATLTGVPDPGLQLLGYLVNEPSYVPFGVRTNPAQLRMRSPLTVRAIFGLPIPESLDVTNGWRIDEAGWFGQSSITHDGVDAVQSSRMLGAPLASLELSNVVLTAEGTITFWWKVDGTPVDELRFQRNNLVRSGALSGSTDWQHRTYYLPAGTNRVRWYYDKIRDEVSEYNGVFYAPLDAAWVDEVTYAVWPDPALDADSDGMRDIWEMRYFDDIGTVPTADADNDGVSNLDEFLDGTDPSNNSSFLPRLTVLSSGGSVVRNPNLPKYTLGQTVQLEAVPDPDNYFVAWGGAVSGTNTTNSVLMNRHQTVIALFGLPLPIALDTPTLSWTRSGQLGWFGQTSQSRDGVDAAQSGPIGLRQDSWMETTVSGPATLMYWWRAASSTNQNFGRLHIDGVEQPGRISGQTGWRIQSAFVNSGTHTLRWVYSNNTSLVSLTNGVWVDEVSLTPGTIAPTIFEHPADTAALQFQQAGFAVQVGGTPPLAYEWFHNGVSLGAGTNSVLVLDFINSADAGSYSVRVSNAQGATTSSNATLTILPFPPANDDFTNRTALAGANSVLGYTHGATREPDEPNHAFTLGIRSVWWSWVAPANGNFQLSAIATNVNVPIVAAVYRGTSLNALIEVESGVGTVMSTNGMNLSSVAFTFPAVAGTSYAVVVDTVSASAFLNLSIGTGAAPVLGSVGFSTGGAFGFSFAAQPGARYVIQASTDLRTWAEVASGVVGANGTIEYSEPVLGGAQRFYRLLLPP